jgi:uncharacterized protein YbjT (DUF2867 family)
MTLTTVLRRLAAAATMVVALAPRAAVAQDLAGQASVIDGDTL